MNNTEFSAPEAALNDLIREVDAPDRVRADFEAWLRERGIEGPDLQAMLEVGAERFLVYRHLVQNRLRKTTRQFIPRTAARLGSDRLRVDFEAFMHQRAPRSPYLRDVPTEFVAWVGPRWQESPDVPDYLADLARHELLEHDVRNDPGGGEEATGLPLALDRALRFDSAARLMKYQHAVHRLPVDEDDRSQPDARPTHLLVYRDERTKVRYLELTELASAILQRLLVEGMAVEGGLRAACESLGHSVSDEHLATAAQLLADLAERGVMLGAEPTLA